jgi:ubiquitin C-terminal hydrolase
MNSALQCLSNMDVLRAYFLKEVFKYEINFENAMGSKGEVVTRFAELLN